MEWGIDGVGEEALQAKSLVLTSTPRASKVHSAQNQGCARHATRSPWTQISLSDSEYQGFIF